MDKDVSKEKKTLSEWLRTCSDKELATYIANEMICYMGLRYTELNEFKGNGLVNPYEIYNHVGFNFKELKDCLNEMLSEQVERPSFEDYKSEEFENWDNQTNAQAFAYLQPERIANIIMYICKEYDKIKEKYKFDSEIQDCIKNILNSSYIYNCDYKTTNTEEYQKQQIEKVIEEGKRQIQ